MGTEDALSKVITFIEKHLSRKEIVVMLALDITGAFDQVLTSSILNCMTKKFFPSEIVNWYKFFLENRTIEANILDNKMTRKVIRGTPQGFIMSSLSWNLVMDDLLDSINDDKGVCLTEAISDGKGGMAVGYADDGAILMAGQDLGSMIHKVQAKLNKCVQWGKENGLSLSKDKTQYMVLRWRNAPKWRLKSKYKLRLDGDEILEVQDIKYLGLTINNSLSWFNHIDDKLGKAKKRFMQIKRAVGTLWGPSPRLMCWAYKAICLPILT